LDLIKNKMVAKSGLLVVLFVLQSNSIVSANQINELNVITSADPDSNKAHSFIYVKNGLSIPQGIKKSSASSFLHLQIPFVLDLPVDLKPDEKIQWTIKTKSDYVGSVNILSKFSFKNIKKTKGSIWFTDFINSSVSERERLVFRPKPAKHQAPIYKKGRSGNGKRRKYGGGTRRIDHKFFNPRLSYQVKAVVRGSDGKKQQYTAKIEMDNKDLVRQEYILHYGINRYGRGGYGNLPVPFREELTLIPDMPEHLLGKALSESRYGLMIDDGLTSLAFNVVALYEKSKKTYQKSSRKFLDLKNKPLPIPKSELWLSGGWRNPERNEWYSNALNGIHQRGGAVDIVANEPHNDSRSAIVYWFLWTVLNEQNKLSAFWQLETNGRPMTTREFKEDIEPANGIPDAFDKADHMHINIKYD